MNAFAFVLLAVLCASANAAAVHGISTSAKQQVQTKIISSSAAIDLRDRIVSSGGCNANVCFAVDGSGSINSTQFRSELNFVTDIVSIIAATDPVGLAAVQYSTGTRAISEFTTNDFGFIPAVDRTRQLFGQSFVAGGINFCFAELFNAGGPVNKIVLLGDARSNIGSSAIRRADQFRAVGGTVCSVAAGTNPDRDALLGIAGGDPDLVFEVDDFINVIELSNIIEKLVEQICRL